MKLSCSTSDFLQAIQLVSRAIGSQQALPILGNILMESKGDRCTVSATDLELSIVTSFPAHIETEGAVTVPAKALVNFVQYNNDPEMSVEVMEGTKLRCVSKRGRAVIAGEAASEYPSITEIEYSTTFSIEAAPLLQALHVVTFAAARTTLRPVLSGVYVRSSEGRLILVATDSYRLSEYRIPTDGGTEQISCIIPVKILDEVRSALSAAKGKDAPERISVALGKQQIEVRVGQTRLLSRLIDGKFPNYEQIVPKDHATRIRLPLAELSPAVKRLHYFAREVNNNLTFHIANGEVKISTPQTQSGRDEAVIAVEIDGKENKIALSSSYLLDFLGHVDGEAVEMRVTDSQKPAVFAVPGDVQFFHLIMPLRMQEE